MLRKLWWRRLLRELKELGGLRCNYSSVSSPNWIAFTGGAGWAPSVEAGASLRTDCHLPTVRQLQWFLKKGRKMVFWSEALSLAVLCLMEPFAFEHFTCTATPSVQSLSDRYFGDPCWGWESKILRALYMTQWVEKSGFNSQGEKKRRLIVQEWETVIYLGLLEGTAACLLISVMHSLK